MVNHAWIGYVDTSERNSAVIKTMKTRVSKKVGTSMGIYAIKHPHGYFKIGQSNDPTDRCRAVQLGSPYELTLWRMVATHDDGEEAERKLHSRLKEHHKRGEWFSCSESQLEQELQSLVDSDESAAYHIKRGNQGKKSETPPGVRFDD